MTERAYAAVEFAMAVAVLMLPVAIMVMAFGPWSEKTGFRRVSGCRGGTGCGGPA